MNQFEDEDQQNIRDFASPIQNYQEDQDSFRRDDVLPDINDHRNNRKLHHHFDRVGGDNSSDEENNGKNNSEAKIHPYVPGRKQVDVNGFNSHHKLNQLDESLNMYDHNMRSPDGHGNIDLKGSQQRMLTDNDSDENSGRNSHQLSYDGPHSQNPNYSENGSSMNSRMMSGFDPIKQINNQHRGLYVDLKIEEDDEDEEDDIYDINMASHQDIEKAKEFKRVYDAKYKMPQNQKMIEQNIDQIIGKQAKIYKHVRRYKKATNVITAILMGASAVCIFMMYLHQFITLLEKPFYVTRTRVTVTEFTDNQFIKVSLLKYFLYRNESKGATDATDSKNQVIVSNLDELCEGKNSYALFDSLEDAVSMKHNVGSTYMYASVGFDMLLIGMVAIFNVIYVSFYMREHHVPIIFRNPETSLFYDQQRAKNFFYLIYIILTGILAQLNFYVADSKCLHTKYEDKFSSLNVDMYQYALLSLLWVVAVPLLFLFGMIGLQDNMKVGCYPIVIANIIFGLMLFILTQIIIVYAIMYAERSFLQWCHIFNYGTLGLSLLNNYFYKKKLAKYDITLNESGINVKYNKK
eukprot:403336357